MKKHVFVAFFMEKTANKGGYFRVVCNLRKEIDDEKLEMVYYIFCGFGVDFSAGS
ncbi:conserved hypothetical protein [delta proteobacterium NaphS2]|nr:conserved hypothetical protein [delta proteobacterium NaphS2]